MEADWDTFEKRQAYIEQCWHEIRESEARVAASKAQFEMVNSLIQAHFAVMNAQTAALVYAGMFNPNFCKPGGPS